MIRADGKVERGGCDDLRHRFAAACSLDCVGACGALDHFAQMRLGVGDANASRNTLVTISPVIYRWTPPRTKDPVSAPPLLNA